ncbi:MAG: NADH-quinone oxidoreductase subunit NuoE [Anaerolineae bacterium]|mgnify:FL=1|jgi:NADH-quinone oxidoreductase subunit E|nr:NADH-quinone oxidoreductase subunit NuoE [Anaerolineae bacterium]MBT3712935.1 NADH-quinone oxidoreductase subunit NuoE [Anaerolineae bacterium]MBT4309573.1 NADH-quinone oxidoreductase subunit NuoE [Anaerolineae bacterium]MBT4458824.1 NADH-quinone oxidoreductase subunit NuoE [Anaerolineae bacterium]MBT4842659.1 NADH-quinone oxidoreductase subunit NuoE [Anaerolineae bacterium]
MTVSTQDRSALIPLLQQVQVEMGYVPREAITEISRELRVSTSDIFGVLTFYAQFRLTPVGRHQVKICQGTACHVQGAPLIIDAVEEELGLGDGGDTTEDGEFTLEKVACFGACSLAPVMIVDEDTKGNITPDKARRMVRKIIKAQAKKSAVSKNNGEMKNE